MNTLTVMGENGVSSVHFPCYQMVTSVSCRPFMYANFAQAFRVCPLWLVGTTIFVSNYDGSQQR